MTEPADLALLLGQRVTVTSPNGARWAGTLTALADQPTAVIDLADGGRVSLPQSHTYTVVPRPEDDLREQLAAATARAEQAEERARDYRQRILDIDAHATAYGVREDDPDGSPAAYLITPGSLHRALGAVGHTAPKCNAEAALASLHQGEEPYEDEHIVPTPAQWIWQWNRATPAKRLEVAGQVIHGGAAADRCFLENHPARIADLQQRYDDEHATAVTRAHETDRVRGLLRDAETRIAAACDALNSVHDAMACDSRDWALDRRDAWLYAILVGWDDALPEVAYEHRWSTDARDRAATYRTAIAAIYTIDGPAATPAAS